MSYTIPVIIPSYEPDDRMLILLNNLCIQNIAPIIIVDDGSSNKYMHFYDEARKLSSHIIVLRHEKNQGKGRGLKTAFSYCLKTYPDLLGCITADSDGQHTPEAIKNVKTQLEKNANALVLGVRSFEGNSVPVKSRFGNNLTKKVFKLLYGIQISDTQTGLRGIPKKFMEALLNVEGERFEFETQMLIRAIDEGFQLNEVQIETIYDSENHSTHFNPILDSIRIYRVFGCAFGKFLFSSLSSSVIDLLFFQILCGIFKHGFSVVEYVTISTVGARIISALYNYSINYFFVFNSKKKHHQSAVRYFVLAIIQMVCSAVLTSGLVVLFKVNMELLIKIPIDIALFLVSYQIQKRYVY